MKRLAILFALLALVGCSKEAPAQPVPSSVLPPVTVSADADYLSALHNAGYNAGEDVVEDQRMLAQGHMLCNALDTTNDVNGLLEAANKGANDQKYVANVLVFSVKYLCPNNVNKLKGFILDNGGNV